MAEMIAEVYHVLKSAGIEEVRARRAAAVACAPSALEPRLAELAFRIERLEKAVVARWEEVEFRLDELEAGLTEATRPGWPV